MPDKYSPPDLSKTAAGAAAAANQTTADSFVIKKSGLNVVMNGKYQFSFSYLYADPNNASNLIPGTRSPNFIFTLQTPDLTQPVTNLVVTPGLLSYSVKWDLIDKALTANKWLIDIQIYESLTGAFAGEEYLVWDGNGSSATILVSNTANRWIRVDTRDQDYRKKSAFSGMFKATDPIVVDTVGPDNVTSVSSTSGIDTTGYLGFNAYANISWPAVTGGGIRGYRIRFSNDNGATYSYVDSPGTGTTYKLAGLAIGSTYKIAVATYDEYNNTSSSYVSGSDVTVTGTPSVSNYISGGPFQFGVGVGSVSTNKGLYFDASNYWYVNATNSARLRVGGASSNYLLWDGSTFAIDGNVTARSGTFSGNIFMSTSGASIYNGTIDATTGNLTGNGFALNSTGLKVANGTNSVTIAAATGTITANAGSIGGWTLSGNTLSKNNVILDSTGQIQVGSSATSSIYLNSSNASFLMWAGNNTPDSNAKFRVGTDGTLYAVGAVFGAGTSVSGYATSTQLTAVDTKATNAASSASTASTSASTALANAQQAATDANTAKVSAAAAKAIADAALPSTSFNRDAIVNSINSTTTTTTINGGKITTGTVSADAVVTDFISTFSLNADKITTGTLTGRDISIAGDSSTNRFKTSYNRYTSASGMGPISSLGINAIAMISVSTSGVVSHWYPYYDAESDIGTTTYKWRYIRSNNGSIQTSDIRKKTNIADSDLGLNFINLLRPVKYNNKYDPLVPEVDENNQPILDENGNRVLKPNQGYTGSRYHYGLIAQEVKSTLDQVGIGDTFSGWTLDNLEDPDSYQGLSYDKFIAPMIKSIQELSNMVESLQQEVNTLKGI
jgi:hypothetical protein